MGPDASIGALSERLWMKHHRSVELIERLEVNGLVRRSRRGDDRREVLVSLHPRGLRLLEQVARRRIGESRATGAALAEAISILVKRRGKRARTRKDLRMNSKLSRDRTRARR